MLPDEQVNQPRTRNQAPSTILLTTAMLDYMIESIKEFIGGKAK